MTATDWKTALGALASELPPGDDSAAASESDLKTADCKINPARLRIDFERKGRAGKCATIISGFDGVSDERVAEIASILKKRLASGGSARGGEILIQGDRRDEVRKLLNQIL